VTPKVEANSSKTTVLVENVKPGQKIKVTVVEGNQTAPTNASPKATPKPSSKPSQNTFKVTTKEPVKVVPSPSGSKAAVGITNLKPGQKIRVTVKTGGTQK
jgi:hypothetical protein